MTQKSEYSNLIRFVDSIDDSQNLFSPIPMEIGPKARFDDQLVYDRDETFHRYDGDTPHDYAFDDNGLPVPAADALASPTICWGHGEPKSKGVTDRFLSSLVSKGAAYDEFRDAWISIALCEIEMGITGRMAVRRTHNLELLELVQRIRKSSDGKVKQVGYHKASSGVGLDGTKGNDIEPSLRGIAAEVCSIAKQKPLHMVRFVDYPVPAITIILDQMFAEEQKDREKRQREREKMEQERKQLEAKRAAKRRKLLSDEKKDKELPSYSWYSISDERLEELLWKHPMTEIAVMCSVSEAAVRKRIKARDLKKPPRSHIWQLKREAAVKAT